MIKPEDCTIIIPHLGGTSESEFALEECIKSLDETIPDIKKIVVFNGDNHSGKVRDDRYIVMEIQEQGQCKAVNAAVEITDTPWIFVTNDDMIYAPGWWEKLTALPEFSTVIKWDPQMFCISPKLIEPRPGAPTFEVFFAGGAGGDFDKEKWIHFVEDHPDTVQFLRTGFNLPFLIKRELWDTVGGYDINYDPWGASGDTDLECKIMLAGVQPYQNTNCIVYHFSQTSGTFEPRNHGDWAKNYAYFQEKWGFERGGDPNVWIAKDCINYEKLIYQPYFKGKYGKSI